MRHTQKAQRTTRIAKDTLRNFPHQRLVTPGFRAGTSASSATSLNRAGIESGGAGKAAASTARQGGCRLGLLVPNERPPAQQPVSKTPQGIAFALFHTTGR